MSEDRVLPRDVRSLGVILVRTARELGRDRVPALAAEVSFFALLSIPPLLGILATTTAFIAERIGPDVRDQMQDGLIRALGGFLSSEVTTSFVTPLVEGVFTGAARGSIFSVSLLVAVWSSSRLAKILIEAIDIAYGVEEYRSGWRRRGLAVVLTLAGLVALGVFLPFVVAGPNLGAVIDGWVGGTGAFEIVWTIVYWPVTIGLGLALIASLYHVAPNWWTPWVRDLPGAALALAGWALAALGMRVYVAVAFDAAGLGPLAAPVVLMLWLYASSLALLLGAELNGEIEAAWPTERAGMKVSGSTQP